MTPVRARDVHCRFGRQAVLRGIDLEIRSNEIVALLGANGSGKTTLFTIFVGLRSPDRGEIQFGTAAAGTFGPEIRARLAWVAHVPQLYPLLTARENLDLYRDLWGTTGSSSRPAAEVLAELGLADVADRPVQTFSRGMAQRVVLARALAQGPDFLVLDEPFTALDRAGRGRLGELLRVERERGAAILFSSHDLDQVAEVADRAVLLEGGVIVGAVARDESVDFRERVGSLHAAAVSQRAPEVPGGEALR
jgi:heme ABC exporter ATP-binding subunit CcmA